jgi:hypothetical protein
MADSTSTKAAAVYDAAVLHSVKLAEELAALQDRGARDWAGFFAALAAFAAKIMPLIIPLFAEQKKD